MALFALATGPAMAEICKYVDENGNVIYSNFSNRSTPENGLKLLDCIDLERETATLDKEWRAALAKIKIGMTDAQMRAADPLLRHPAHHRVVESASGIDEWLEYPDFTIYLHHGRVATIYRER